MPLVTPGGSLGGGYYSTPSEVYGIPQNEATGNPLSLIEAIQAGEAAAAAAAAKAETEEPTVLEPYSVTTPSLAETAPVMESAPETQEETVTVLPPYVVSEPPIIPTPTVYSPPIQAIPLAPPTIQTPPVNLTSISPIVLQTPVSGPTETTPADAGISNTKEKPVPHPKAQKQVNAKGKTTGKNAVGLNNKSTHPNKTVSGHREGKGGVNTGSTTETTAPVVPSNTTLYIGLAIALLGIVLYLNK